MIENAKTRAFAFSVLALLTVGMAWSPASAATLFTTQTPTESYSDGPYELGMKWTSSQAGTITKMRFYRALNEPEDGGEFYVHMGHIWDADGNLLASVPFAGALGRTGEGWETVSLYRPLRIDANKTYVVSVNVISDYVATSEGLASSVVNGPLSSIADGNNGVYNTAPGAFPEQSWFNSNYFVDIDVTFDEPAPPPANVTVFTTQTPTGSYSDGPWELGMKWTSSQAGTIKKMRFYRALNEVEDGGEFYVHMGHIWDANGNLLASVPFAGALGRTGEGWETVSLFQPLAIQANTTYVVSVNILNAYVATPQGLASSVVNGALSSIAGENGVYSTTPGTFPTQSYNNTNYFVDVEVELGAPPPPPANATVLTTQTPTGSYSDGPYELGMKWTSTLAGTITKMRFYRALNEAEDGGEFYVHMGHIWDANGNLLASVPFAGGFPRTGEGWETVLLFPPLAIQANTTYVVSVNVVSDYVATPQGLASSVVNGPLSSIAGGNGVFSTTPGAFPTQSYNNTNYFVDVQVDF